ncbi:hypothetical protein Q4563_22820, partial [Gilvimarinus sp. 1_MG-2023]|nr:hypothetical protein [Gilvimarinus sp. 1_MG-2023]
DERYLRWYRQCTWSSQSVDRFQKVNIQEKCQRLSDHSELPEIVMLVARLVRCEEAAYGGHPFNPARLCASVAVVQSL